MICSFGIHNIHQRTNITEGGVIGMMLLIDHWLHLSPAYITPVLDASCYLLAFKILGGNFIKMSLISTSCISLFYNLSPAYITPVLDASCYLLAFKILGGNFIKMSLISTSCISLFYKLWEQFPPILPDLSGHPLIAAVLGGLFVGVGVGLIVRQGGSSGGDDALALVIAHLTHWRLSRSYPAGPVRTPSDRCGPWRSVCGRGRRLDRAAGRLQRRRRCPGAGDLSSDPLAAVPLVSVYRPDGAGFVPQLYPRPPDRVFPGHGDHLVLPDRLDQGL